jgi:hypothetical protein
MARSEQNREDILREAMALVERAELSVAGFDEPVVVGFRRNGAGSVFFGADPVYQFDSQRRLRRAYDAGRLIKADKAALVAMTRERTPSEVHLISRNLSELEAKRFLERASERLFKLRSAGQNGNWIVAREVSPSGKVVQRIADWLESLLTDPIEIASSPHAR